MNMLKTSLLETKKKDIYLKNRTNLTFHFTVDVIKAKQWENVFMSYIVFDGGQKKLFGCTRDGRSEVPDHKVLNTKDQRNELTFLLLSFKEIYDDPQAKEWNK